MALSFGFGNHGSLPVEHPLVASGDRIGLQTFFLDRLTRLVRKVHLHGRYLVPTDRRMQLLNRAILSTYEDCQLAGVAVEARAILADMHRDVPAPAVGQHR
jgi:hypothetical protein